ncbi:MAG TPA: amylo-alpha-1,6-glucosidase [Vicinamibacterales bacterium]|nr:amylo-alpha-1,6-glucosidase [Vicinamibacterales bacterium]
MDDVIQFHDQYYILATASRARERSAVLQHGDTFAVFDLHGDIGVLGPGEQGLYHEGTRYLSRFRLRLNNERPLLLSARVKDDNELFGADLTNGDMPLVGGAVLARDIVHVFRARFIWDGTWHERVRLCNYGRTPVRLSLSFECEADFADIFEVRGTERTRRGTLLRPALTTCDLSLGYRGLDGEGRRTIVTWSEQPSTTSTDSIGFDFELQPQSPVSLCLSIRCDRDQRLVAPRSYREASSAAKAALDQTRSEYAIVETSSERFNQWVRRSAADLRMLATRTEHGEYPYAGVPWFCTPFGRDGIITALQTIWINPRLARGVLTYLAATQADEVNVERDAEPGKILHETRSSEMARLGEVPFGRYYGSVDATPLFVVLAGAYLDRTGDRAFASALWPHVERALSWIDRYGDRDGDGFVEYSRRSPTGLVHQGWKDSQDSVFHADGTLAEPPIALCEVQGYVYDARCHAAKMAEVLGHHGRADRLRDQAERLRASFEERFWCEKESTYALALDGHKQPCRVRTSNAGHCLFSGIVSPERASKVAQGLISPEGFSGWGIRTVLNVEPLYNPMSYHNGSVWPHDNGIIAAGFSRYGLDDLISVPFSGLFDASFAMDAYRLPELFCGFHRRTGEGPTLYPVACSPQAWAAGVVFHLIQSCLRLSIDSECRSVVAARPVLPPFLTHLRLLNLELPFGRVDLLFERSGGGAADPRTLGGWPQGVMNEYEQDVRVSVLRQEGDFDVRTVTLSARRPRPGL